MTEGVSHETPSVGAPVGRPQKAWSDPQRAELKRYRLDEGYTVRAIAELMGRTPKSVECELGRRRWVIQHRVTRPDALAEIAAKVAALEAEEGDQ